MSSFHRSGHTRVSKYGVVHWVRGHSVSRYDWVHSGGTYTTYRSFLDSVRAGRSAAARFVNPNAKCPECGADVFYYQNEFGSRVYFDELGPPWPKHPCTDVPRPRVPEHLSGARGRQVPSARARSDIAQILQWTDLAGMTPGSSFQMMHGTKPWRLAELLKLVKEAAGTFMILRDLTAGSTKKLFLHVRSLPPWLRPGDVVALGKQELSVLDGLKMMPRTLEVTRIRSAAAFVDAWTDAEPKMP